MVNSTSGGRMESKVRTSSGTFLSNRKYGHDTVIQGIERRMDNWAMLPYGKNF